MRAHASSRRPVFGTHAGRRRALAMVICASTALAGAAGVAAQELEWAAVFDNGVASPSSLPRIAADAGGGVYAASSFTGTVDFDPGAGIENSSAAGVRDAVVVAFDRNRNFRWAATMGGNGAETQLAALGLDSAGHVIVGGRFVGVVDFDPGPGTTTLNSANGGSFLVKLDPDGALGWAVQLPGSRGVSDLAITAADDVVSVGSLQSSESGDFDPGVGTVIHLAVGNEVYLSKLDASAAFVFVGGIRQTDGAEATPTGSVSIGAGGAIHLAISAFDTLDVDPSAGGTTTITSPNDGNGYTAIMQLSPAMALEWAVPLVNVSGSASSQPFDVTEDSVGATYVAGSFSGTVDFEPGAGAAERTSAGPGGTDGFLVKFDSSGGFDRVDQLGGTSPFDEARSVSVDKADQLHLSGTFGATVDFDPGLGIFELTALGTRDAFVVALESDGTFVSAQRVGGTSSTALGGSVSATVGRTVVGGSFNGTVDLDPGPGTASATGTNDAFLLQLVVPEIFADGFESGDTSAWSAVAP